MLSVIMLNVIMLMVIMLMVIMLMVIMLSVIMLSVIMLSVIMLSVVAPSKVLKSKSSFIPPASSYSPSRGSSPSCPRRRCQCRRRRPRMRRASTQALLRHQGPCGKGVTSSGATPSCLFGSRCFGKFFYWRQHSGSTSSCSNPAFAGTEEIK